mgnify:CR=1 FL=1
MKIIDGSFGEGGGQILRTALAISSLLKEDIKIINIRKNRNPPGLKNQHLHSILLLKKITRAQTNEIKVGETELYFKPNGIFSGYYEEDIGTAGSITLLLQAVLLPCLFADNKIKLKIIGGTDVKNSPSLDYFRYVLLPYFQIFADIDLKVIKRGFYPKGGGEVILEIKPKFSLSNYRSFSEFLNDIKSLGPLNLAETNINKITIYSVASEDLKDREVAERMINGAIKYLNKLDIQIKIYKEYVKTYSTGAVITIVGDRGYFFGSDSLGEKNIKAEDVGKRAAEKFLRVINNNVSVDENLADNLIPILGLVNGYFTTYEITGHLYTNIWLVNNLLSKNIRYEKIGENKYKIFV